jgi:hypothetical protein
MASTLGLLLLSVISPGLSISLARAGMVQFANGSVSLDGQTVYASTNSPVLKNSKCSLRSFLNPPFPITSPSVVSSPRRPSCKLTSNGPNDSSEAHPQRRAPARSPRPSKTPTTKRTQQPLENTDSASPNEPAEPTVSWVPGDLHASRVVQAIRARYRLLC